MDTPPVPDQALVDRMLAELQGQAPLPVICHPMTLVQVVGLVQLALRHPGVSAEVRAFGAQFIAGVRAYFAACPAVLEVIRRGEDPR